MVVGLSKYAQTINAICPEQYPFGLLTLRRVIPGNAKNAVSRGHINLTPIQLTSDNLRGSKAMIKKRQLFLIGWIDGSDTADDFGCSQTHLHTQDDLYPQFMNGNDNVMAVEIINCDDEVAYALGLKEAFFKNYTAYDSFTNVVEIPVGLKLPCKVKVLNALGLEINL